MTDAPSAARVERLRVVVGVCAFGGVFLFMWAAASEYGPALGLAVALWVIGGVLSVGITDDTESDDEAGSEGDDGRTAGRGVASSGNAVGPGNDTSADVLEELRNHYARGEMSEAEFEHRVERLLAADETGADDALRTLRKRYAEGDLSDEQFERKLDRLTETRTLEDATDAYECEESTGE